MAEEEDKDPPKKKAARSEKAPEERPPLDPPPLGEGEGESGRLGRLTRRLLERGDDAKLLLGSVLDSSDRAKNEMVRLMAREVRNYLEALRLKEDLVEFATSHRLEVKATFSLEPLAKAVAEEPEPDEEPEQGE